MTGRFRDLLDRRVPQYLGLYVGVGWGLVQVISFFERYDLNPVWTDITLVVLVLLIPSVLAPAGFIGDTRDTIQLRAAMAGVDSVIQAFSFTRLKSRVHRGDAVLHEVRGDWAGALARYRAELKADPSEIIVQRDVARMYRLLNRPDDARTAIDLHLRIAPTSAESNMEAARIALARRDAAGAATHVQRAARTLEPADRSSAVLRDLQEIRAANPLQDPQGG